MNSSQRLIGICQNAGMSTLEAKSLVYARDVVNLRDHFAIAYLAGYMAHPTADLGSHEAVAAMAYEVADVMVAARGKES